MTPSQDRTKYKRSVLYAKNTTKKNKTWYDGFATFSKKSEKMNLFDQDDQLLIKQKIMPNRWSSSYDTTIDAGRYIVMLEPDPSCMDAGSTSTEGESETESTKRRKVMRPLHLEPPSIKYNYATVPKDAISIDVMFTDQKTKKNKTWMDGHLYYYDGKNKAILYAADQSFQERYLLYNIYCIPYMM